MHRPPRLLARFSLAALLVLTHPAVAAETISVERERYLMGTRFTVLLQGADRAALESAATAAFDEVARYEDVTSNWREDSELSSLHTALDAGGAAGAPVAVSADLFEVLAAARGWAVRSEGAFDATIEPLTRAWDLRGKGRVPSDADVTAAMARVQGRDVVLDPSARTVQGGKPGLAFDLGGIAKGAAIDRAVAVLRARGVERALLNFGGQVYGLGAPVGAEAWSVELADPRARAASVARVSLRDRSVSTTAASERSLEVGNTTINHVLDPRTGRPSPAWGSAVVVAARAIDADAASTALYVLGPVEGRAWVARQPDLEAILLVEDVQAQGGLRIERVAPTVAVMAAAQDPASVPDNAELARRIDVLSSELEDARLGEVAGPARESRHGLGPAASKVYGVGQGVSIGGYGEMLYENFAGEREDGVAQFTPDQIDFLRAVVYVGYKFSDKLLFNSETEFEHASTGKRGTVSVEFAYLDFMIDPLFNLRAGMILPPMGFVNELHEPPTYLGSRRPDVEQRILPSTWRANGIGAFGESESGFAWRAYLCEGFRGVTSTSQNVGGFRGGDGVREARQSGSFSRVEDWGLTGLVEYRNDGFRAGVSGFTGGAAQGDTTILGESFTGRTSLWEAHAEYKQDGIWLRALYGRTTIDEAELFNERNGYTGNASVGSAQFGWYGEAGYDVMRLLSPGSEWNVTPFVRYENYDTQAEVPEGYARNPANERVVLTAGASAFPHPQVVLKADHQWRTNEAETGVNQFNMAIGYLF